MPKHFFIMHIFIVYLNIFSFYFYFSFYFSDHENVADKIRNFLYLNAKEEGVPDDVADPDDISSSSDDDGFEQISKADVLKALNEDNQDSASE